MQKNKNRNIMNVAVIGGIIVLLIVVVGTFWMGQSTRRDTDKAVREVSLLYLDELAGRREQVVESNLQEKINDLQTAVEIMEESDLSDDDHLRAYQSRMRRLYGLDKFAFVDEDGLIHTADGTRDNIGDYSFDYKTLSEPEISILNLSSPDKKVIIAVPVSSSLGGKPLKVCFMEIDMDSMLTGVSVSTETEGATFCNLYTNTGVALSNKVLGGLAAEDSLVEAMKSADYDAGYSYERFLDEFGNNQKGVVSFTYGDINETLSYVPVKGTDWMLTYLIRESVISDRISNISNGIVTRNILQSLLTIAALMVLFVIIIMQSRRNSQMLLESETKAAVDRAKQEDMEERLALQEKLLEEEKNRRQQDSMITAMATDYRSVYHVDLETDEAICFRSDAEGKNLYKAGDHFSYIKEFTKYADFVAEPYREGFLQFIQPETLKEGLLKEKILAYRYLVQRDGQEYYEMIRAAGVRFAQEHADHIVHAVGIGFTVIDAEMRESLAQRQALRDALATAEQANRAKTAFLSSMSHEIRTPMNAIIGLDNIALNDPDISPKTREFLEKIGESAEHLLGLINDILDMSRIESGRMTLKNEEFSFHKMLDAINTMFSGQCDDRGVDYQCHITGELDDYYIGDSVKLRQVLINILGNAVKFTPEGGKVSLDIERVAQYEGKTTLSFRIADTGIGMSPEFLPHIFDAFAQEDASTTSRYGSSGLGLAITRNIVEMMNGNIAVESEKGVGSVFTVTVTLADAEHKNADGDEEEIRPGDMTVLVVDDDPVACEHAKLVLEKAGISAELAGSGAEAIEMVRLRHARREPYNLILVDWQMPELDGVETARRMREIIGHESAIIILTAYRWDDVLEEAMRAGVDSFISKPLFAAVVLEEFKSAIRKKNAGENQPVDLTGRRILVAEDVEINAEIVVMLLDTWGISAEVAENGRIAVDKFSDNPPGYYDAILMDMRMPEMDGLTATRTIRAMDREDARSIPIIAMTANAFDEDVQRSLQAGLNAHLSKPVQPDSLFETLGSLIK